MAPAVLVVAATALQSVRKLVRLVERAPPTVSFENLLDLAGISARATRGDPVGILYHEPLDFIQKLRHENALLRVIGVSLPRH